LYYAKCPIGYPNVRFGDHSLEDVRLPPAVGIYFPDKQSPGIIISE